MPPHGAAANQAKAARRREKARREKARNLRPPFCPPTGHFDNGDYAGVQLHVEDEVRVNNYREFPHNQSVFLLAIVSFS